MNTSKYWYVVVAGRACKQPRKHHNICTDFSIVIKFCRCKRAGRHYAQVTLVDMSALGLLNMLTLPAELDKNKVID